MYESTNEHLIIKEMNATELPVSSLYSNMYLNTLYYTYVGVVKNGSIYAFSFHYF